MPRGAFCGTTVFHNMQYAEAADLSANLDDAQGLTLRSVCSCFLFIAH